MHWLVAMRGWLKFIEWYSKWLAQAHQMMDAWGAAGARWGAGARWVAGAHQVVGASQVAGARWAVGAGAVSRCCWWEWDKGWWWWMSHCWQWGWSGMAQLGFVVGLGTLDGGHMSSGTIGWWGWVCHIMVVFLNGPGRVHHQILHNNNKNVSYERLKWGKQKSLLSSGRYTPEQTCEAILPTPNLLRSWYYGPIPKVSLMSVDALRSCQMDCFHVQWVRNQANGKSNVWGIWKVDKTQAIFGYHPCFWRVSTVRE